MKSNLVSYIFLILSIILIVILFQVNYAVRQFENEIGLKEKKIKLLKESNKVLFTEFSAHINPDYIPAKNNLKEVLMKQQQKK